MVYTAVVQPQTISAAFVEDIVAREYRAGTTVEDATSDAGCLATNLEIRVRTEDVFTEDRVVDSVIEPFSLVNGFEAVEAFRVRTVAGGGAGKGGGAERLARRKAPAQFERRPLYFTALGLGDHACKP